MTLKLITRDPAFPALFWTQFFGALNDNFLKNALLMLVTFRGISLYGLDAPSLVALSGGIFIAPFFILSPLSGQLGERFDKSQIARFVKLAEIGIMGIAALGFWFGNFHLLLATLLLMGIHSTVFGPIKYSLIPELVHPATLVSANAAIETGTFLAILIGTVAGGIAIASPHNQVFVPLSLLIIAGVGWAASRQIPRRPPARAAQPLRLNPFPEITAMYRVLRPQQAVWNSILGLSWFWFLGAAILSMLPAFVKEILLGNESVVTFFLTIFTVGVALGSILCERLSFKKVEIGLVPFGSLGLSIFALDLGLATLNYTPQIGGILDLSHFLAGGGVFRLVFDFIGLSIASGLFTVPLYALIQERCAKEWLSRAIAMNNIVNAFFMVISALFLMGVYACHVSMSSIFLILGVLNFCVALYIYSIVPEFTLRFLSWILIHLLYRVRARDLARIPDSGPAILVCNHISYVDWLLLSGIARRPVRFVMYYKFAQIPLLRYLLRQAHVIPIAGIKEDPEILDEAYRRVHEELHAGELVCIFPEGQLSRDGQLGMFKSGVERMLKTDPVTIVPIAICGLWGSLFSFEGGRPFLKAPKKLWQRIEIKVGPLQAGTTATAHSMQIAIADLLDK